LIFLDSVEERDIFGDDEFSLELPSSSYLQQP
jgi:hypothetical protein